MPNPSVLHLYARSQRLTLAALGVALLLLLGLAWSSSLAYNRLLDTQRGLLLLERVQADLTDLETGERGFIITGDERFLAPYTQARARVFQNIAALGDQETATVARQLDAGVRAWLAQAAAPEIRARRRGDAETAAALVRQGTGKAIIDRLRTQLEAERVRLSALVQARSAQAARATWVGLGISAAALLGVVLLVLRAGQPLARVLRGLLLDFTATAERLGSGDLSARLPELPYEEPQALARSFGGMAERLRENLAGQARQSAELRRSNRELEQFAFAASHDLRTPLRTIVSFSGLLERRLISLNLQGDERTRTYLHHLSGAALQMQTLVDDLLRLARAQHTPLQVRALALEELVTAALQTPELAAALQASGASIQVQAGADPLCGDPALLPQVFAQLLGNAVQYRHPDRPPQIVVRSGPAPGEAGPETLVRVEDNGVGIEPAYRERVFSMFQRLHRQSHSAGSGVGLSVCRNIVERHGGRIWIEDGPGGVGAALCFTLPNRPAD